MTIEDYWQFENATATLHDILILDYFATFIFGLIIEEIETKLFTILRMNL